MAEDKFDFAFEDDQTNHTEAQIIEDSQALDIGYIPDKITHRDKIIRDILGNTLRKPIAQNEGGQHGIIIGPPGSGKTATAKYIIRNVKDENPDSNFEIIYMNCSSHSNGQAIFKKLCEEVGTEFKPGVELADNITRFKNRIKEIENQSIIIVLDEVHCLTGSRRDHLNKPVLYQLSRPTEEMDSSPEWQGNITILAISNDEILTEISDEVNSSFDPKKYDFTRYTEDEICDILMNRQEQAYTEQMLSKHAIKKISNEVYSNFDSDVRKAIDILKKIPSYTSDISELKNDKKKQLEIVEEAIRTVQKDRIQEAFYSQDPDFYIVMAALHQQLEADKSRLKYITESYEKACELAQREKKGDNFQARRSFVYRHLEKLVDLNLLEKSKHYDGKNKPSYYEANFDLEIFQELVEDRLRRNQVLDEIENGLTTNTFESEAEDFLGKVMGET